MKILVVDNDNDFIKKLNTHFTQKTNVTSVHTVLGAIEELEKNKYDLVIMDWMLPMKNGKPLIDWCHSNKEKLKDTKVWVHTAMPADRIKKYTNGNKVFSKYNQNILSEISLAMNT